jgi:hypothetical protein
MIQKACLNLTIPDAAKAAELNESRFCAFYHCKSSLLRVLSAAEMRAAAQPDSWFLQQSFLPSSSSCERVPRASQSEAARAAGRAKGAWKNDER